MTVKELIEKLNRVPHNDQDAQVYFADLYIGDYVRTARRSPIGDFGTLDCSS